jgi:hypothetical protein
MIKRWGYREAMKTVIHSKKSISIDLVNTASWDGLDTELSDLVGPLMWHSYMLREIG